MVHVCDFRNIFRFVILLKWKKKISLSRFSTQNLLFIEQLYLLQRLVRSPILRESGLVHSFLTPGHEMGGGLFEPDSVGREAHRKVNSLKSKLVIEVRDHF